MIDSGFHRPGLNSLELFLESPKLYLGACKICGKLTIEFHVLFGSWKSAIMKTMVYLRAYSERTNGLIVMKPLPIKRSYM